MKKSFNKNWHAKHKLSMPSTLAERVKWYVAHSKHCSCRKDMPKTIVAALKAQGKMAHRGKKLEKLAPATKQKK